MVSRARKPSKHLFDCFVEIVQPRSWKASNDPKSPNFSSPYKTGANDKDDPWVLQTYPTNYVEKSDSKLILKAVPSFVYPCFGLEIHTVQNFSFVMTDAEAKWTYGFCRLAPSSETALVILSGLPWHETFYKILNFVAELLNSSNRNDNSTNGEEVWRFLEACRSGLPATGKLPEPGTPFHISWTSPNNSSHSDFTSPVPDPYGLPSIPENRNLSEYYNAVGVDTMLAVFAAMLHERRIMITSRKLYRLTACVQAANSLIYPMSWQHLFIPVLPKHLIDYLSAPMPYLVGVPIPLFKRVRPDEIGEVVVVDVDTNAIISPFDDVASLPPEVVTNFKRSLRSHRDLLGDAVARAFLQATVHLIGGYKDALKFREGQKRISFEESAFLTSRTASLRPFLTSILELQIFRQFVEERLQMLNDGKGFTDEFEREAAIFAEKKSKGTLGSGRSSAGNAVHMGKQAAATLKREGADLASKVKHNTNLKSAVVKKAVSKVKDGSKSAYKGVKSTMKPSGTHAPLKSLSTHRNNLSLERPNEPHSAPASPTLGEKRRPSVVSNISGVEAATKDGNSDFESYLNTFGSTQSMRRFGSSTLTSSSTRPLAGNFVRTNTDLGFSGPVLKYERFDPPPVNITNEASENPNLFGSGSNSITHKRHYAQQSNTRKDSDCKKHTPLDLDLMADLEDIINRKTSPLECNKISGQEGYLHTNGQRKVENQESMLASDLIILNNGSTKQSDIGSYDQNSEIIFDPLLQAFPERKESKNDVGPNVSLHSALPRPPSKSSIQHIARNHNIQQQQLNQFQHQPLTRTFEPNSTNEVNAQIGINSFSTNTIINDANQVRDLGTSRKISNGISANNCDMPPTRELHSKSSENLLKEYGLENMFNTLSVIGSGEPQANVQLVNSAPQNQSVARPIHNSYHQAEQRLDIFAELDPLRSTESRGTRPVPPPRPSQPPLLKPSQAKQNANGTNELLDLSSFDSYRSNQSMTPASLAYGLASTTQPTENFTTHAAPIVPPRNRRGSQKQIVSNPSAWENFE